MKAAYDLVRKFHPKKIYANFIIELVNEGLNGRSDFDNGIEITSLIQI
jgi:adenine phosphoribosyltransferase